MFNKFSPGNKPGRVIKNSQADGREKDKEILEKLSRIEESYVDAAIRSVKRKSAGRKNSGFDN